jgi:hypothetical protein
MALSSVLLLRFQLRAERGSSRKVHYLPKGEREPETAYRKRLDAARPSGFFRDALRTYAGMLGRGTDLGVFLAAADLLVLRDVAALVLVLPPPSTAGPERATARRPCAAVIASPCPGCSWWRGPTA